MSNFNEEEHSIVPIDASESRNFHVLKTDNELFDDEEYVAQKIINVKRVNLKKGEDWEILEDSKVVLTMKGTRFTNLEKEFLRTVEGMKFIIAEYKIGTKTVVKFKEKLKDLV